jgi:hypothetical protein
MSREEQFAGQGNDAQDTSSTPHRRPWEKPKLTFIAPKLTRHGKLEDVTGQFFGAFSPGRISTIR